MSVVNATPLLGAGGEYQISRSVRLRSSASAYFNRTLGTATNSIKWTVSFWVKRGQIGVEQCIFAAAGTNQRSLLEFTSGDALQFSAGNGTTTPSLVTTQVFRDPSAWYHFVCVFDSANATSSNRMLTYVNGVQITSFSTAIYPTSSFQPYWNTAIAHYFGKYDTSAAFLDAYLAEVNFIDGQALTASSFGVTDSNGIWQPKAYTGTYGTNGFYLKFTDNSAATAAAIGKDYSGNGNNWTPNNISVTAGTTYDSMIDSPTVGYAASNYAVLNPLSAVSSATVSNGNLLGTVTSSSASGILASIACNGKNYCETKGNAFGTAVIGISCFTTISAPSGAQYYSDGRLYVNNSLQGTYATFSSGDTVAMDVDTSTRQIRFYKNNVQIGSTGTASGTDPLFFGVAGSGAGTGSASTFFNFGQSAFTYTPPTGFAALNTYNLPAATINNGATVMAASTYTGTGATQSIVNSGNNAAATTFKPDLVWIKNRSAANSHNLADSIRGPTAGLASNLTSAEYTQNGFNAFNTNGFALAADTSQQVNNNGSTYVGWQWQAGQGTTSSNTNGSITSTVSVNQSAGFSVATFTAQASGTGTVGHGLGVAPSFIITKQRAVAGTSWTTYHSSVGNTAYLVLNTTAASATLSTVWNNTSPTSSVFTLGSAFAGASTMVAYCWSEVAGYSKFGSYIGNGSADGPFVYCGFRPRWIMRKRTDSATDGSWLIVDTSRDTYNSMGNYLFAESSAAEGATTNLYDVLSNGFKLRSTSGNVSGGTYIYAAFAENPFNISRAR